MVQWSESNIQLGKIARRKDIVFEKWFLFHAVLQFGLTCFNKLTIKSVALMLVFSFLLNGMYNNYIFLNKKYNECVYNQQLIKDNIFYSKIYSIPICKPVIFNQVRYWFLFECMYFCNVFIYLDFK